MNVEGSMFGGVKHSSDSCKDPDYSSLHKLWTQHMTEGGTQSDHIYLLPAFQGTIRQELENPENTNTDIKYRIWGRDSCAQTTNVTHDTDLEERSLCEWHYVLSYDKDR